MAALPIVQAKPLAVYPVLLVDEAKASPMINCTICHEYMYNPIQTSCNHLFCEKCYLNWYKVKPSCPMCQAELKDASPKPLKVINPLLYNALFGDLQVRCPSDCKWTGDFSSIEEHILKHCVKHRIPCTHCTREIARGDLAAHMAACKKRPVSCQHCTSSMAFDLLAPHIANTCVKAPTVCDAFTLPPDGEVKGCGRSFARDALVAHQRSQCVKTIVACDLSVHGCMYRGPRELMDEHDTKDAIKHVGYLSKVVHRLTTSLTQVSRMGMFAFGVGQPSNAWWITPNTAIQLSPLVPRPWCTAVRATDDTIYVVGGEDHGQECYRFQLSTKIWTKMADTLGTRLGHTMVSLPALAGTKDGRLMAIGGVNQSVELYDIATNKWSLTTPMSTIRICATAVVFASKVFVFGGAVKPEFVNGSLNTCESYEEDVKTNVGKWTAGAPMPTKRDRHAAVKVDNTILIMGGSLDGTSETTDSVIEYTPASNSWRDVGWKLPVAMQLFGAIYDEASRTLMIAGGYPEESGTVYTVYTRTQPFATNEWILGTTVWAGSSFGYC